MSLLEKPSIYNAPSIYNQDQSGGSVGKDLLYLMGNDYSSYNNVSGWKFNGGVASVAGSAGRYKILTGKDTYPLCPVISGATKSIEASYKFYLSPNFGVNYSLMCCALDVGLQLFEINLNSNKRLDIYLESNNNATIIYQKLNDLLLSSNVDYTLDCFLDIENSRFRVKVNDSVRVDVSVNINNLHLNKWVPCIGGQPNYTSCYIKSGFNFYCDSLSYKIDGVEQIT